MKLIFIYGAPATGKLTVADELAKLTGYKLLHNHLTVDLVGSFFKFGSEQASRLSSKFRLEMFEEAAKANLSGIIFTYVYAKGLDDEFIQKVIDTVNPYNGKVEFVLLKCDKAELLKRVEENSRKDYQKIHQSQKLKELFEKYDMFSPISQQESLIIDNTNLNPHEVAEQIIKYYNLLHT